MNLADQVIVEFYGIPRARAGRAELRLPVGTVAEVLLAIETACPALRGLTRPDGSLVRNYLLSLDGKAFLSDPQHRLQAGQRVLLLSADVGG